MYNNNNYYIYYYLFMLVFIILYVGITALMWAAGSERDDTDGISNHIYIYIIYMYIVYRCISFII